MTKVRALFLIVCANIAKHATAASALAAGATAATIGADPIPWALGAAAASVVYAYKTPKTRAMAAADALICVFIGGLVAPFFGSLIKIKVGIEWSNDYVLAFGLAASWPWLAPLFFKLLSNKVEK